MKKIAVLSATVLFSFFCRGEAAVWYVDADNAGKENLDGTSQSTAFADIQSAIDAASAGDTVLVYGGRYETGEQASPAGHTWGPSRILIENKKLHLKAVEGAEKTFIVGSYGALANGLGEGALRCINVDNSAGTVIEGFTLLNGSTTVADSTIPGMYGAFYVDNCNKNVTFLKCVVDSCRGFSYVGYGATLVRSKITDCHFLEDTNTSPKLLSSCVLVNSVCYRNSAWINGDMLNACTIVNCSLVNNKFTTIVCNSNAKIYNSVIAGHQGASHPFASAVVNHDANSTNNLALPVMSTALCDIRVRDGSLVDTLGEAEYLSTVSLPEGIDAYVDFEGNEIPRTGAIMAGALQKKAVPAGGAIMNCISSPSFMTVEINGVGNCYFYSYVIPDVYPTQYVWKAEAPSGKRTARLRFKQSVTTLPARENRLVSAEDNSLLVMPPADADEIMKNTEAGFTSQVLYVKPDADAGVADGTEEKPYRTIQAAIDATSSGSIIYAYPGVYDEGKARISDFPTSSWARVSVPLGKTIRLVSLEGAEKTVIKGEADPILQNASYPGCGTNAVRCVGVLGTLQISGFTLTGGYTDDRKSPDPPFSYHGGAAYVNSQYGFELVDSIVSNNFSRMFLLGTRGTYRRCLIKDNHSYFVLAGSSWIESSIVEGNTLGNNALFSDFVAVADSTVIGNGLYGLILSAQPEGGTRFINSVFCNMLFVDFNDREPGSIFSGCVFHDSTVAEPVQGCGYKVANPCFPDAESGDYRLFVRSEARSAVLDAPGTTAGSVWWYMAGRDFFGERWNLTGGKSTPGAVQEPVCGVFVRDENSALEVVGGGTGYNASVESVGPGVYTRPVVGVEVNGVTNFFNDLTGEKYTLAEDEVEGDVMIAPVFSDEWFVDAENGDDSNRGYYPADAKKTLAAALSNASLKSGDTVKALPGLYDELDMVQPGNYETRARAYVPEGVTLESVEGPETTIIEGKPAEVNDYPLAAMSGDKNMHGMGVGALRCVFLGTNARVKGFTLRNGHTRGTVANSDGSGLGTGNHHHVDFLGGGVCSSSSTETAFAENCVITGCSAFRGGGANFVTCQNCVFTNNASLYGGGGAGNCYVYGCLSVDNVCEAYSRPGLFFCSRVEGCTILDSLAEFPIAKSYVSNTLIPGRFSLGSVDWYPTNGFVSVVYDKSKFHAGISAVRNHFLANSEAVGADAADMKLDGNFRPVIGENVGIDGAVLENLYAEPGEKDLGGMQRIYNGAMDIGAFEADWRENYAYDLVRKRRGFAVIEATPGVYETELKSVVVAAGDRLVAEWESFVAGTSGAYTLKAKVSDGATLALYLNGGETACASITGDGTEKTLEFKSDLDLNSLEFVCQGETGTAELYGFRRVGTAPVLIVR